MYLLIDYNQIKQLGKNMDDYENTKKLDILWIKNDTSYL